MGRRAVIIASSKRRAGAPVEGGAAHFAAGRERLVEAHERARGKEGDGGLHSVDQKLVDVSKLRAGEQLFGEEVVGAWSKQRFDREAHALVRRVEVLEGR